MVDLPTPPLVLVRTMFTRSTVARKHTCWQEGFLAFWQGSLHPCPLAFLLASKSQGMSAGTVA
jgi:hypothetical protein